jgi:serine phosphatase RsbU (regulator of sigma subunit)
MFGAERLQAVLAAAAAMSASELAAAIESAVLDFSGRVITDDTAIMVVQLP